MNIVRIYNERGPIGAIEELQKQIEALLELIDNLYKGATPPKKPATPEGAKNG